MLKEVQRVISKKEKKRKKYFKNLRGDNNVEGTRKLPPSPLYNYEAKKPIALYTAHC